MRISGIVDWDTHFWQPIGLWIERVDPKYRDAILAEVSTFGALLSPEKRAEAEQAMTIRGADHVDERLAWMDSQGMDASVVYPSLMAHLAYLSDGELAAAACRGLNEWSAEFAAQAPERLFPCLILPWHHPELALAEFERARHLDFRIAFSAPTPSPEHRWSDSRYDPLWQAMQDANMVMTFHEFTRFPDGKSGNLVARPTYSFAMVYLCGHTIEIQLSVMDIILGGVCDRFPGLKVGFIEGHCAWLPGWLSMLDQMCERPLIATTMNRPDDAPLPTEIFQRQCFLTAFPDDRDLGLVIRRLGAHSIVVSSDYPHPNMTDKILEVFEHATTDLKPEEREQVLRGNTDWILNPISVTSPAGSLG